MATMFPFTIARVALDDPTFFGDRRWAVFFDCGGCKMVVDCAAQWPASLCQHHRLAMRYEED